MPPRWALPVHRAWEPLRPDDTGNPCLFWPSGDLPAEDMPVITLQAGGPPQMGQEPPLQASSGSSYDDMGAACTGL